MRYSINIKCTSLQLRYYSYLIRLCCILFLQGHARFIITIKQAGSLFVCNRDQVKQNLLL